MPANLPPQYFEVEKRYRESKSAAEKIEALEEMLMIMPKHKGTDKLRADLRRRISKLKSQSQERKGPARREGAFAVEREGAAQVVLLGPPNTGKSSLVAQLTNAAPEVADFPHSTWKAVPGMVEYQKIQFQLVDTPPLGGEYVDPALADLFRRSDILALVLDIHQDPLGALEQSLEILQGLRIFPQGVPLPEDLKKPPFVKKTLLLLNKVDSAQDEEDVAIFLELADPPFPCLGLSAQTGRNLTRFLEAIYDLAGIIRVFTKAPGKQPDLDHPFVLPKESTLEELAGRIHKDFVSRMRYARLWGTGVYDGQMVQKDHVLRDGDVVEFHIG